MSAEIQSKIFVINLKRSPGRRKQIIRQMELYGLQYEFFDAVDGSLLPAEIVEKARVKSDHWYKVDEGAGERMKLGELGVAMSHYKLYQKIIKDNLDLAIILEDDVNFAKQFQKFVRMVKGTKSLMKSFDLVLLGYCANDLKYDLPAACSYWGRRRVSRDFCAGIPVKWYWSAIAYVVSKKGAILLSQKQGELPSVTADMLTANSPQYGVRLGVLTKQIAWPGIESKNSTIQPQKIVTENLLPIEENVYYKSKPDKFQRSILHLIDMLVMIKVKLKRRKYFFTTDRY